MSRINMNPWYHFKKPVGATRRSVGKAKRRREKSRKPILHQQVAAETRNRGSKQRIGGIENDGGMKKKKIFWERTHRVREKGGGVAEHEE